MITDRDRALLVDCGDGEEIVEDLDLALRESGGEILQLTGRGDPRETQDRDEPQQRGPQTSKHAGTPRLSQTT